MTRDLSNRTHGIPGTYTAGCRCEDCRRAWSEYSRRNRHQRAYRLASHRAAQHVRQTDPDAWACLFAAALIDIAARDRPT